VVGAPPRSDPLGRPESNARSGLVGRDREQATLHRLVEELSEGRPGVVALVGEPGIGKSALALDTLLRAETLRIERAVGRGARLAFDQPLHALGQIARDLGVPGTAGAAGPRNLIEAALADPTTLELKRILDEIERRVTTPTLVVLEDAHWADDASLTAMHHLGAGLVEAPISVLVTMRPPTPGSALADVLLELDTATVLELEGLAPHPVAELVARRGMAHVPDDVWRSIETTDGNPMLIEAILAHPDRASGANASLRPIERQVAVLPPPTLAVLQIAAVLGTCFAVDTLGSVLDLPRRTVLERLASASANGVIIDADAGYRFRHDLYRDSVLAAMPSAAVAAHHLDIADALRRLGAPTVDVAEHLSAGATPDNRAIIERLVDAAVELVDTVPATALRISERVLELLGDANVPRRLQLVRVAALAAAGRAQEADVLGNALLQAGLVADVEAAVRRDLALSAFVQGRADDARSHMTRVVQLAESPSVAAKAESELAWARFLALDPAAARECARSSIEHGEAGSRIAAEAVLAWISLWALDREGATRSARVLGGLVEVAPPGDWHVFQPLFAKAAVEFEIGELDAARDSAERGRELAISRGTPWATPTYDALVMSVLLTRGDLAGARDRGRSALAGTVMVDGFGVELWVRAMLARIALLTQDLDAATEQLAYAEIAVADGRAQLGLDHLIVAQAGLQRARGEHDAAFDILREGWALHEVAGINHCRGKVASAYALACVERGDRDEAERVSLIAAQDAEAAFPSVRAEAARARAFVEQTPAAVEAAVAACDDDLPLLAHTLATCVALPGGEALSPARLDEVCARLGVDRLPTSPPPAPRRARRPRAAVGLAALTASELRAATLVAEGLTNTQIAERLTVSRRTIDSHVLSCYRKLDVSSRVALTRALLDGES